MQLRHSIHLYFDNGRYIAVVPSHPDCRADGASYAEALGRVELMLQHSACGLPPNASNDSIAPTASNARGSADLDARSDAGLRCRSSAIKARLVAKFGRLSNRQLAARIGIVAADAPVMLSSALGGRGSRQVRCAIALALDELPSLLWPDAAGRIRSMDDSCFLDARRETDEASSPSIEQDEHSIYAD